MGFSPPFAAADGWTLAEQTWTYASATTFTVAGDQTAIFTKGTRIKLTNSTVKYFVVTGSAFGANTTVTVTGGSDYSLANAAISANYYSYQVSPAGYPGTFNFAGAASGFSAFTVQIYVFWVIGNVCNLRVTVAGTSNATTFGVMAPITSANSGAAVELAFGPVDNGVTSTTPGRVSLANASAAISLFKDMASGAWTNTGAKAGIFNMAYPF